MVSRKRSIVATVLKQEDEIYTRIVKYLQIICKFETKSKDSNSLFIF